MPHKTSSDILWPASSPRCKEGTSCLKSPSVEPPEDSVLRNDLLSLTTATTPRGGEPLPSACFDKRESTGGGDIGDRRYVLSLVRVQRAPSTCRRAGASTPRARAADLSSLTLTRSDHRASEGQRSLKHDSSAERGVRTDGNHSTQRRWREPRRRQQSPPRLIRINCWIYPSSILPSSKNQELHGGGRHHLHGRVK